MYCSISCSRAARSPCSWYRRSSTLSFFSGTSGCALDRFRELDPAPVAALGDVDAVDRRLEHTLERDALAGLVGETVDRRHVVLAERPDRRAQRVPLDPDHKGQGAVTLGLREQVL